MEDVSFSLQKLSGYPEPRCEEALLKAVYRVDELTAAITSSDVRAHTHAARSSAEVRRRCSAYRGTYGYGGRSATSSSLCVCVGGPSGFGLLADRSISPGGGDSFGAAADREGGGGGVPVVINPLFPIHRGQRSADGLISTIFSVITMPESKVIHD